MCEKCIKLEMEIKTLREIAKSKTPAQLTQAQAERMPPEVWYSKESYDELKQRLMAARLLIGVEV
jgi:hypothetical protein